MTPSRTWGVALAAIAPLGCGARTGLSDSSGAGGGAPASTPSSASASSGSTSSSGGGGAGGGPCQWQFGPVVELEGHTIWGAAVDGDHLLLLRQKGGAALAAGPIDFALTSPGPMSALGIKGDAIFAPHVAAGFGHATAITSDDLKGCTAVALGPDGQPLGPPTKIFEPDPCPAVAATPTGFFAFAGGYAGSSEFVSTPITGIVLDANATASATIPDLVPADGKVTTRLANAVLDDGSLVLLWSIDAEAVFFAQRFDPSGTPLTPSVQLGPSGFFVKALSLGSSMLVAWNRVKMTADNEILVATLDASLNVGPAQVVVPAPSRERVLALVDGGPGPGTLLVTTKPNAHGSWLPAEARWLAPDGATIGAPFQSQIPSGGVYPIVVGTPSGPILFSSGIAQRVECR